MAKAAAGLIDRIYPSTTGTNLRLTRTTGSTKPKGGYFLLKLNHPNYDTIVSLAMLAADSRRKISIRTVADISSSATAVISYVTLDFPPPAVPAPPGNSSGSTTRRRPTGGGSAGGPRRRK